MADFNITDPEIIKMLKGLTEEGRQAVADQLQESLNSGEVKEIVEGKVTKGNHIEPSEDSLELRIKELEEELATATHCWGVVSERLDWLEDRMAPENAGKSFVIELCDDYRDRFFEIKEDAIQSPPNRKSCAIKAAKQVMEEHSKAFEKLAENEE